MTAPILIVGTGGHARRVAQAVQLLGLPLAGFFDENADALTPDPTVPLVDMKGLASLVGATFVVAIGHAATRERLQDMLSGKGLVPACLVHPRAYVAPDARLGAGTVVLAGAIVESRACIGDGGIVDIGALVDHDSRIGHFCHIRPGSIVHAREAVADRSVHDSQQRGANN